MADFCTWLRVFFFFQAEDGIRDLTVTGVQTCALPISPPERKREHELVASALRWVDATSSCSRLRSGGVSMPPRPLLIAASVRLSRLRSEERRVGKECRSRWSPYH